MRIEACLTDYVDRAGSKGRPDHGCEEEQGPAGDPVARNGDDYIRVRASLRSSGTWVPFEGIKQRLERPIRSASTSSLLEHLELEDLASRILKTHFLFWNVTLAFTRSILISDGAGRIGQ